MSGRDAPCLHCTDRRVGCHDAAVCARWAAFSEAQQDQKEACREALFYRKVVGDYTRERKKQVEKLNLNKHRRK